MIKQNTKHLEILQMCRNIEALNPGEATEKILSALRCCEYVFNERIKEAEVQESRRDLHNVFKFPGGHHHG